MGLAIIVATAMICTTILIVVGASFAWVASQQRRKVCPHCGKPLAGT